MNTSKISTNDLLTHDQISDFIKRNFIEIKNNSDINDLIRFHSINKFLLMAHSPNYLKLLGNLVANQDELPLSIIFERYEKQLQKTLQNEPTVKSHSNVLQKIFGFFKKDLTLKEKSTILEMLSNYRSGNESLNSLLLSLEELTRRFQKTYLVRQTYFLLYCRTENHSESKND